MTEDEAKTWLTENFPVSRETLVNLETLASAVTAENQHQNLVSAATIDQMWARHIVDSAQLLLLAPERSGTWIDLGTGAGFPGLVVAILSAQPMILVESRRKRFEFLRATAESLNLDHVSVHAGSLDSLETTAASVISARAFAPLPKLLDAAIRFSRKKTLWLLPKGRSAPAELESIRSAWQGEFHVKPSVTDDDATIITATGVQKRK